MKKTRINAEHKYLPFASLVGAAALLLSACPGADLELDSKPSSPPAIPGAPSLTARTESILLIWDEIPSVDTYELAWTDDGSDPGASSSLIGGIQAGAFLHEGLDYSKTYAYRLRARNAAGAGGFSSSISAKPLAPPLAAPSGLKVVFSSGGASIEWDDHSTPGVTYRIARRRTGVTTPTIIADGISQSSFIDSTISPGLYYFYKVMALLPSEGRESAYSAEVSNYIAKGVSESERNNPTLFDHDIWGDYAESSTLSLDEFYISGSYSSAYAIYNPNAYRNFDYDLFKISLGRNERIRVRCLEGDMSGAWGMGLSLVEVYETESHRLEEIDVHPIYSTDDTYTYRPAYSGARYIYLAVGMPTNLGEAYSYGLRISISRE
jgi:hypothetical protein